MSKKKFFQKIELWIHDAFRSGKSVIELRNLEQGIIVGNGRTSYPVGLIKDSCSFKFKILVKDNKAKIKLYQFDLKEVSDFHLNDAGILKFQNKLNESLVAFLNKKKADF